MSEPFRQPGGIFRVALHADVQGLKTQIGKPGVHGRHDGPQIPDQLGPGLNVGKSTLMNARSEEHTSELQSLFNLVCRLLLEKKKT